MKNLSSGLIACSRTSRFGMRRLPLAAGSSGYAVHDPAGLDTGHVEDGRSEVDVDRVAGPGPTLPDPGSADQRRDPDRVLVRKELRTAQPVLALQVAVVRVEDEVGVLHLAGPADLPDDLRDLVVDRLDRAEASAIVVGDLLDLGLGQQRQPAEVDLLVGDVGLVERRRCSAAPRRRRCSRTWPAVAGPAPAHRAGVPVGGSCPRHAGRAASSRGRTACCGEPNSHEVRREGSADIHRVVLFALPAEVVEGLEDRLELVEQFEEAVRRIVDTEVARSSCAFGVVGVAVVADLAVDVERVVVVVVGRVVEQADPAVPARRDLGAVERAVLVEVLADQGRAVAGPLQPRTERVALVELAGQVAERVVAAVVVT